MCKLPEIARALDCSLTYLVGLTDDPRSWEPDGTGWPSASPRQRHRSVSAPSCRRCRRSWGRWCEPGRTTRRGRVVRDEMAENRARISHFVTDYPDGEGETRADRGYIRRISR